MKAFSRSQQIRVNDTVVVFDLSQYNENINTETVSLISSYNTEWMVYLLSDACTTVACTTVACTTVACTCRCLSNGHHIITVPHVLNILQEIFHQKKKKSGKFADVTWTRKDWLLLHFTNSKVSCALI